MKKSRYLQIDKTEKIYSSPRQEGTYLYFTGAGDDMNNSRIGEGPSMYMTNGSALDKVSKEIQFLETVFIKDGYLFWENAKVDLIRFVNKFHLIGSNNHGLCIESNDAAEIESMLKFRLEIYSPTKNPDLTVSVMMEMYRENTI
jgi:hypothetical protein